MRPRDDRGQDDREQVPATIQMATMTNLLNAQSQWQQARSRSAFLRPAGSKPAKLERPLGLSKNLIEAQTQLKI